MLKENNEEDEKGQRKILTDKIAVITSPKKLIFAPYEPDKLAPGEVLIKMIGCGLDPMDIPLWEGREWINYPLPGGIPGREGWGVVVKVGEFTSYKEGDVVVVYSHNSLSTMVKCTADKLHKIPDKFRDINYSIKAIAFAVNVFEKADIREDHVVVILGNGFISSLASHLAKNKGAKVLKVAKVNAEDTDGIYDWHQLNDLKKMIKELTHNNGCDIVMECTGTTISFELATTLLHEDGKIVLGRKPKNPVLNIDKDGYCGLDITLAYDQTETELSSGVDNAVKLIEDKKLNPEKFTVKTFSFNQLEKAFEALCSDSGESYSITIRY